MKIKVGSLFDGIGRHRYRSFVRCRIGLGIRDRESTDIHHKTTLPNMKHYGDITQINGQRSAGGHIGGPTLSGFVGCRQTQVRALIRLFTSSENSKGNEKCNKKRRVTDQLASKT